VTQVPEAASQTYDTLVERGVRVPARDGAELLTDIFYPAVDGKRAPGQFPVLLLRTPYGRASDTEDGHFFAGHGYVTALQDWRQTQGEYDMSAFKPKFEDTDGYDAVEWLAAQPWSNGKVGIWGHSARGQAAQSILAAAPPSLASAFVLDSGLDYGAYPARQNGCFGLGLRFWHSLLMARSAAREPHVKKVMEDAFLHADKYFTLLRRPHAPLVKGETVLSLVPEFEEYYLKNATIDDLDDPFWKVSGAEDDIGKWKDIPTCFVAGWYANHLTANFTKYRLLSERFTSPVKLIVGHWDHMLRNSHAGGVDFGPQSDVNILWSRRLQWFDETMRGIDRGETSGAGIEYFVMGGGSGKKNSEGRLSHGGRWERTASWPPAGAVATSFYLNADRTLSLTPPTVEQSSTTYTFDPRDPVPTVGGNFREYSLADFWARVEWMPEGAARDQRANASKPHCRDNLPLAQRDDVIVFQTAPLEEDTTISGELLANIWVSSSAPDTDFSVKLIDVFPSSPSYPEGFAMNLQDAIVRMRYRNGRRKPDLIKPGEVYELTLPIHSTANVFRKGHRIRLDVSSSNFPRIDVNLNNGGPLGVPGPVRIAENTIHHDARYPSRVVLPIVPQA
jgi:putative CocE/NonD family hydrolase